MVGTLKLKGDSRMIELAAPERREGERSEPSRSGGAANSTPPAALPVGTEVIAKAQRRKFTAEYKLAIIEEAGRATVTAHRKTSFFEHHSTGRWRPVGT
jgi:hypothetical protein